MSAHKQAVKPVENHLAAKPTAGVDVAAATPTATPAAPPPLPQGVVQPAADLAHPVSYVGQADANATITPNTMGAGTRSTAVNTYGEDNHVVRKRHYGAAVAAPDALHPNTRGVASAGGSRETIVKDATTGTETAAGRDVDFDADTDGEVNASYATSNERKTTDGEMVASNNSVKISHTAEGRTAVTAAGSKAVIVDGKGQSVGGSVSFWGDDEDSGVTVGGQTSEIDGATTTTNAVNVGLAQDGASLGGSHTVATSEAGQITTSRVGGAMSYKDGDFTATGNASRDTLNSNGSRSGVDAGVTTDFDKTLGAHVGAHALGPDGKPTAAVSVGGSLERGDGVEGYNASMTATLGPAALSIGGGERRAAAPPVKTADGRWVVYYSETTAVNLGVGGNGVGAANAFSVGGSVGEHSSHMVGGCKFFDTEELAVAFQKHLDVFPIDVSIDSAGGARTIPVGETRMTSDVVGGSVGASGSAGVANASAEGHVNTNTMTMVRRVDQDVVEVTVLDGATAGGSVGVGAGLAGGVKVGTDAQASNSTVVEFDLKDETARAAYEKLVVKHEAPSAKEHIPGVDIVRHTEQHSDTDFDDWAAAGGLATASHKSTVAETVIMDKSGELRIESGQDRNDINIPLIAKDSSEVTFDAVNRNASVAGYGIETSFEASGNESFHHMAAATDVPGNQMEDHRPTTESSGRWTVTTHVSKAQVDEFMAEVESGAPMRSDGRDGGSSADSLHQSYTRLGKALNDPKATDLDKQKALAEFFAETGGGGVAVLRTMVDFGVDENADKRRPDVDLALPNDPNFTGPAFREENDALAAQLWVAVRLPQPGPAAVAEKASQQILKLRMRRNQIRDLKRYTDLPNEVRGDEVLKTDHYISVFESVKEQAFGKLEPQAMEAVDGADSGASTPEQAALRKQMADIRRLDADHAVLQAHAREVEANARKEALAHGGAFAGTDDSAREAYTDKSDEVNYQLADQNTDKARLQLEAGDAFDAEIDAARIAYYQSMKNPAQAAVTGDQLVALLNARHAALAAANAAARSTGNSYKDVEKKHAKDDPDQDERLAGLKKTMSPGIE